MYVENPESENPRIYTITNEQLEHFVNNNEIDSNIRENILMAFIYFDNDLFGSRFYTSLPLDLFETIHPEEGLNHKSFAVLGHNDHSGGSLEAEECYFVWNCKNHEPPSMCDGCAACFIQICFYAGGGIPDYGDGNDGGDPPTNPGDPTNPGGNGDGNNGQNTPEIPWYISNYSNVVQTLFMSLWDFQIMLGESNLDFLEQNTQIALKFRNYIANNNTLEAAQFVVWGINYFMDHSGLTWQQFQNLFMKTPCEKIKNKQNDTKYSEKFNALNQNSIFSMNRERGFFERQSPTGNNLPSTYIQVDGQEGTSGLSLPDNKNGIVGLLHSHNDESNGNGNITIKIFSPTDVRTFINYFMPQANSYLNTYSNAYSTVVTSLGSYTLQFNATTHPGDIDDNTWEKWKTWYKREYQKLIDEDKLTQANVEKKFTQFLKEKVNIAGIEVYRVTGNTAIKLEYDGKDKPVKETACP